MNKGAGIGIGVAIVIVAAISGFYILDNSDVGASSKVKDISSLPSNILDKPQNDTKNQIYEINTKCELIYLHLTQVENNGGALPIDVKYVQDLIDQKKAETEESVENLDMSSMSRADQEKVVLKMWDELKEIPVNHAMEYNSIDPKLRPYVYNMVHYQEKEEELVGFYDMTPEDYEGDLECGKKLHEAHSDTLYEFAISVHGKSFADERQTTIQDILYG